MTWRWMWFEATQERCESSPTYDYNMFHFNLIIMNKTLKEAIQFVRDHRTWSDETESRALQAVDHMRCPLRITYDGGLIVDEIHDLMEEYSLENGLPEGWWFEQMDEEQIFWEL